MGSPDGERGMTTDVVIHEHMGLTLAPDQTEFTEMQLSVLRQIGVKDATRGDMAVFHHVCQKTGLDPFARQIYMLARRTMDGVKQTIQTGIDGYRLIARRAADRAGETLEYEDNLWCGSDGQWSDVWLSDTPPAAAKVCVLRDGKRFPAVVKWTEYVQTTKQGAATAMWARMPANQLAKCAEAAALRKAFPQDLAGFYVEDEMHQSDTTTFTATVEPQSGADRVRALMPETVEADEAEPVEDTPETLPIEEAE
jgi:phage recombination protein Bet